MLLALALGLLLGGTAEADGGQVYTVSSTAYNLEGVMANGQWVYDGAAACNFLPLGTTVQVLSGTYAGRILVVSDRIGWGSDFDVWIPGSGAWAYGRQYIAIRVIDEPVSALVERYGARTVAAKAWMALHGARVRRAGLTT